MYIAQKDKTVALILRILEVPISVVKENNRNRRYDSRKYKDFRSLEFEGRQNN